MELAVAKQVKRYVYPVQLDEGQLQALNMIVERTGKTKSEAIREAIRSFADEVKGMEIIKIRDISRRQARKEILDKNERAWSSEIADTSFRSDRGEPHTRAVVGGEEG